MSGWNFFTGWSKGTRMRVNYLLFVTALLSSSGVVAGEVDVPPLELLEYLGEWEDRNGRWLDPQMLQLAMPDGEEQVNEEEKDAQ